MAPTLVGSDRLAPAQTMREGLVTDEFVEAGLQAGLPSGTYGFFPATVIPITSLGKAGVYFGNTRAFVACSKS